MAPQELNNLSEVKMGHQIINTNKVLKAYLYSIVLLILGFVMSLTSYLSVPASADNAGTDVFTLSVPISCTMTPTVNTAHSINMIGGTYEHDIGKTTLDTTCNDKDGFVVYAIGYSNNEEGNNKLEILGLDSQYDIASGPATSGDTSNWSVKLSPILNGDYTPTIDNGFDNYSTIPTTWTKVAEKNPTTADITKRMSFTTTYAVYLNSTQPAGTYTGQVKYIMLHPSSATRPTTIDQAFALAGKSKVDITDPTTGETKSYYKMQDMTTSICDAVNVFDSASETELVDIRDNKIYWVAKLHTDKNNDNIGQCWMTENLDLDLISDPQAEEYVALTSENTNLKIYGSTGYTTAHGYTCSNDSPTCENGVITWLPERSTISPSELNSTTWKNNTMDPYSYDRGLYAPNREMDGHGYTGNYYNWTAAIASNYSSSYFTNNTVAANSICPKGWRLPNAASMTGGYEFSKLFYAYGISTDDKNTNGYATSGYNKLVNSPLYFVQSGRVNVGSLDSSDTGHYASSTIYNSSHANYLQFSNNTLMPNQGNTTNTNFSRQFGWSLRCLAE